MVLAWSALIPLAVLWIPVVLLAARAADGRVAGPGGVAASASWPMAVLSLPVVLLCSAA